MENSFSVDSGGVTLKGKYFRPRGRELQEKKPQGKGMFRALVLCHGIPGGRGPQSSLSGAGTYQELAAWFREAGFFSFTFNFRGTGESGGNFDLREWAGDLQAVLGYLESFPEIGEVNLVGFSGGAAAALHHVAEAREDKGGAAGSREDQGARKIGSLVLAACPADTGFLVNRDNLEEVIARLKSTGIIREAGFPPDPLEWLKKALTVQPERDIPRVAPCPVLILHGTGDELIPPEHARRLYRAAREPKELKLVEGAGHRLRKDKRVAQLILDWLQGLQAPQG